MSYCVVCFRRINHMAVKNHLHSSSGVREVVSGTIILRQALPPLTFLTIWLFLFHPLLCHYLHVDDPPIGCCPVAMSLLVERLAMQIQVTQSWKRQLAHSCYFHPLHLSVQSTMQTAILGSHGPSWKQRSFTSLFWMPPQKAPPYYSINLYVLNRGKKHSCTFSLHLYSFCLINYCLKTSFLLLKRLLTIFGKNHKWYQSTCLTVLFLFEEQRDTAGTCLHPATQNCIRSKFNPPPN